MIVPELKIASAWCDDGRHYVRWTRGSVQLLQAVKLSLGGLLTNYLSPHCRHVKGHGGLKRCVLQTQNHCKRFPFVARFDVESYYESISHDILLQQSYKAGLSAWHIDLIDAYLKVPDRSGSGKGLTAGGALSPLLAALYLTPLDRAMEVEIIRQNVRYMRYMDDFVIFARTRFQLRRAIRTVHQVLNKLHLRVHPLKRFIGRTTKGFDFLGYRFKPDHGLGVAAKTTAKMLGRVRRLQEQGADVFELRRYVLHWWRWLHAGLRGQVTCWRRFLNLWQAIPNINHRDLAAI